MNKPLRLAAFVGTVLGFLLPAAAPGYVANSSWPSGTTQINLQLDGGSGAPALPGGGLSDGSASWNAVVQSAIGTWNAKMTRTQLTPVVASSAPIGSENGYNNVFFSSTIYGEAFGSRTLAVTTTSTQGYTGAKLTETDLIVNTAYTWDSYRGSLRSSPLDLRRVVLHELGHVIGLEHPDQDDPPQTVAAIMNSVISDVETLQADDIAGATVLYGSAVTVPTVTRSPQSQTVTVGGTAALSIELNGAAAPAETPTQQYAWIFTPQGGSPEYLFTIHQPTIPLGAAQRYDAGTYYAVVETPNGSTTSATATISVNPVTTSASTRLVNLSTRGHAGSGNQSLIVGFIISGNRSRQILLRAIGPTLNTKFGVAGAVPDPTLNLTTQSGTAIASNDNWGDGGGAATLPAVFTQAGAFALPSGSLDAALVATLPPGLYTASVTPKTGTAEGVALVEAYDIDDRSDSTSRLSNLSTRGYVGTDSGVMIAGLIVAGTAPRTFLLRAAGDSLQAYGVTGTLDDPTLALTTGDSTLLRAADDWDSPAFLQPTLQQAFTAVGAFTFADRQESALKVTLNPGLYTIIVAGLHGGTGVGLVEVYEMDN